MTVAVDYRAIYDFGREPKDEITACNLCGGEGLRFQAQMRDRYGYAVWAHECLDCGLNYLRRRPTKEAYARFYETAYRPLVSAFHGREISAQTIQAEQVTYGRALGRLLEPHKADYRWRLLDVGGSTGVVATQLVHMLEAKATVLDPSAAELEYARVHHDIIHDSIETFETDLKWDYVTLCRTADHLLDLMGSLKKIKTLLTEDGLFWSDIVDFDVTREVKIDHPFNLTEKTYRRFLLNAGFSLLQVNYAPDGEHIGFLCKAAAA